MRPTLLLALATAALACGDASVAPGQPDAGSIPDGTTCLRADGSQGVLVQAYLDQDGDGHGAGAPVPVCATSAATLPRGFAAAGDDCNDAAPGAWALNPFFPDADHDGAGEDPAKLLCAESPPPGFVATGGDCAPGDPTRWRYQPYSFRDQDGDGFTIPIEGTVCAGAYLPAGYSQVPSGHDCYDLDPGIWKLVDAWFDLDGDGVGDGAPLSLCTDGTVPRPFVATGGDCAPTDSGRWRLLPFAARDADGDGWFVAQSGSVCGGGGLPSGYAEVAPATEDCDDRDPAYGGPRPAWPDADGDGVGAGDAAYVCYRTTPPAGLAAQVGDCAPDDPARWRMLPYLYRDADGDGFFTLQPGQVCSGAALPTGYSSGADAGPDCDDADPAVHATVYGYLDADGDGVGAGPAATFCTDGTLPSRYVLPGGDCAPDDPARFRTVTNIFADRDGDGFTVSEPGPLCVGAALPPPYVTARNGNDCDDADPARWRWTVLYPDGDGDGIGAPPRQISCLGEAIPGGLSTAGWDVDDADPAVQWNGEDADQIVTSW